MGNTSGISQQAAAVSWDDNHHLAGLSQMVSYLIVRLEMQYLHIVFHMTVTSAGASHMPGGKKGEKTNRAGHRGEVRNKVEKHTIVLSPGLK